MISIAPHILLMTAATAPVHASSGSGGAVLGAAIFQIVGMVAAFVWFKWRCDKDEQEWRNSQHLDGEWVSKETKHLNELLAEEEALKPWMKEPRMRLDDYQKTLAQQAKWEAEEQEAKNHEHDTPSK